MVQTVKKSAYNVGDLSSIPGSGRSPGGGHGNQFQYSCLENPPGQSSLVCYSPRGCRVGRDLATNTLSLSHVSQKSGLCIIYQYIHSTFHSDLCKAHA